MPQAGRSFVRGSPGAVEANATVRIRNLAGSATASVPARADGSFTTSIEATLGDPLEIVAIDAAGNESPATSVTAGPDLAAVQLRGVTEEMTGVAGRSLPEPIVVKATGPANQAIPGLTILFDIRSGGGASLSRTQAVTDLQGNVSVALTLPPSPTTVEVVARLQANPEEELVVAAHAVGPPLITSVTPGEARPGDTVTIDGQNFSPVGRHNEVSFGGESEASVVTASATRLTVEVPAFATEGPVVVTLTGVASNQIVFDVLPAPVDPPPVGDAEIVTLSGNAGQIELGFEDETTEYMVVVEAMRPNAQSFTTRLEAARGVSLGVAPAGAGLAAAALGRSRPGESIVRAMERRLIEGLPRGGAVPRRALEPAQDVGSSRDFFVVNRAGGITLTNADHFDQVTATLRFKGENTLLYVDDAAASSISSSDIDAIGERFDDGTYDTDVGAFGEPSDIDGNGRVIILLSPTVNGLTTPDIFEDGARIVGFFFGPDLLPEPLLNPFANGGEVFYSVVPDPDAVFGAAPVGGPNDPIVPLLTSVFAHEFEHMISFNQHLLIRNGNPEALWLDEGLAHMAEELNDIRQQNTLRTALFLDDPENTTLVGGGDALDERGAAYLFVQYMVDRFGEGILGDLVQTSRTGIDNVSTTTDVAFNFLFHEWAATLLLDGPTIDPNEARFEMPTLPLRELFEQAATVLGDRLVGPFLGIRTKPVRSNDITVTQKGTSPAYVRVTSSVRVNAPVTITGVTGSELQITVVRIR